MEEIHCDPRAFCTHATAFFSTSSISPSLDIRGVLGRPIRPLSRMWRGGSVVRGNCMPSRFATLIYSVSISGSFCANICGCNTSGNQHGEWMDSKMRSRKSARHVLPLARPSAAWSLRSRRTFLRRPSSGRQQGVRRIHRSLVFDVQDWFEYKYRGCVEALATDH
jgi:hypothetical protein